MDLFKNRRFILNQLKLQCYVSTEWTIPLDVRTKEEFEGKMNSNYAMLKNAINVPPRELEKIFRHLLLTKTKRLLFIARIATEVPRLVIFLHSMVFKRDQYGGGMSVMNDKSCMK